MSDFAMLYKEELEQYSDYLNEEALALCKRPETVFYGAFSEEDELVAVLSVEVRAEEDLVRIIHIAVTPSLQHTGVGSALVDYAAKEAIEAGFTRLVVFLEADSEGIGEFDPFFWRCGFSPAEAYPVKRILLSQLSERVGRTREVKELDSPDIRPFSQTESYLRKKLDRILKLESGFTDPSPEKTNPDISVVYLKGTEPVGCLLVGEGDAQLELKYIFVSKACTDWTVFEKLIARAVSEALKRYGEDYPLIFSPVRPDGQKLLLWFWGQRKAGEEHNVMVWTLPLLGEKPELREITEPPENQEERTSESSESRFTDPGFRLLTNEELKCRDCIYRLTETGVMECHKYSAKPAELFAGGECGYYRKEVEVPL